MKRFLNTEPFGSPPVYRAGIRMAGLMFLAGILGLVVPPSTRAQTLANGSFETPVTTLPLFETTFSTVTGAGGAIGGWSVTENFVDLVNPARSNPLAQKGVQGAARDGSQAINLASGTGRSAISQQLATTNTQVITVTFHMATAKTLTGVGDASLEVRTSGGVSQTYLLRNSNPTLSWLPQTFTFTATGSETLTFRSDDDPFNQVTLIDNISIAVGGTGGTGGSNVVQSVSFDLPGQVDEFFDPLEGFLNLGTKPVDITRIHLLSSSRAYVAGSFATYRGVSSPNFARINANATLDTNFFIGLGAADRVNDFAIQTDGKLVLVGAFDAYNEISLPGVARINSDGGPDNTFLPGAGANGTVNAVVIQPGGGIVIGGAFSSFDTTNRSGIARLLVTGKLDTTFDPGMGFVGTVRDLTVLPSGQYLASGAFTAYNGVAKNGLVRLNADGSLDTGFTAPFETTAEVREIRVLSNGKIIAAGAFSLTGSDGRRNLARLNADGSLDTVFGSSVLNAGANAAVDAIELCSDGSIVIGGEFTTYDGSIRTRLAKLNANGFLDTSSIVSTVPQVVTNVTVITNTVTVIQTNIPPATNIFFGFISNNVFTILSTNTPPSTNLLTSTTTNTVVLTNALPVVRTDNIFQFGVNGGPNSRVSEIAFGSGETPYIGGAFTSVDSTNRNGIARLNSCDVVLAATSIAIAGSLVDGTQNPAAPIAGATVSIANEVTTTAADGSFTLRNAVAGPNPVTFVANGFFTETRTVNAPIAGTVSNRFILCPTLTTTNSFRFIVDWVAPLDLHSVLETPDTNFNGIVEYTRRGSLTSSPFAVHDTGDVFRDGPESITITNLLSGIYKYRVHDFFSTGTFTNALATVRMYGINGLMTTIQSPVSPGGDFWDVLQINGSNRTFQVINNLSNALPTINTNLVYTSSLGTGPPPSTGVGAPVFAQQPNDEYAIVGGNVLLSVAVQGTAPFGYQWYRNGAVVNGATSPSLALGGLAVANAGDYHVVVTNILGMITSRVAQVTVLSSTSPFVFVHPSDKIIDEGGSTSLEILAGGQRPLFYQWRHNGTNLPNAKAPLLRLTNAQPSNAGNYDIIVANSSGIIFSRSANLVVSTPPTITGFNITPGANVTAGETVNLGVGVEGKPPFNFIWSFNGQVLPSALSSNLTIPQVHFTNAGAYQVVVTNILGTATNPPVALTVNSKPLVVVEPQNQFQTVGNPVTLNVGAIGSLPISYQWRLGTNDIAGATSSNLVFASIQSSNVGNYSVVLANQFGTNVSRFARVDVVVERAVLPWLQSFGGSGSDVGQAIGTDAAGNVYTVGRFAGTAQFGTNSLTSAGVDDIFITKMDVNGNVLWAKRFGGPGYDVANDVVVLPSGDVLMTGGFQGVAAFGGTLVTNTTVSSFSDIFVARLDPAGNVTWVRTEGVQFFSDVGRSLAVDGATNVYVVGSSPLSSFNGAAISNVGRVLLAKYDGNGGRLWASKSGAGNSGAQDTGLGVSVAGDGSVYTVGVFHSATYTNAATVLTNRGFSDGFVAKYDSSGALVWLRQVGANGMDSSEAVVATINGDILVAGQLSATNIIGTNVVVSRGGVLPDAFVVNYDAAGGVQWAKAFGGIGSDAALDIAADARGNIYLTGFFQGAATFGAKSVISIAATKDVFVAGIRPNGTVEFVQQAGGDSIAGESGLGVAVDVNGGGVFTGQYQGTFVAGGDSKTSTGADNVFVSRLVSPAPTMAAAPSTNGVVTFAWSSFRAGFVLESNGAKLNSTNWTTIPITPSVVDGAFVFSTNTTSTNVLFLRLRQP